MNNVLAFRAGSYQALKERVEVEEKGFVSTGAVRRRSIRSLKGGWRIGPSSFEACVLRSSGALVALSPQKKTVGSDAVTSLVCRAGADGGSSELEPSSESSKPKESFKLLLRLIPRLLPAIAIGVAYWLVRGPNIALAGVEAPNFVVGGEAAQGGALSREIAKAGGGVAASAWTGLVAGGLHTLTGPDHLAALAPLCIGRSRLQSFSVGALWGCGHDAGQVIFGIIFLLLKDRLHLGVIQTWAARVVGLTLITIGGMGIKEAQEIDAAAPVLAEGEMPAEPVKKSVGPATFITGIVYGLQPDALLMILPALSLPSRAAGAAFLGMFLLGTVLAMGSYTAFVSTLSKALQKRVPKITYRLTIGSSLVAISLGIAVLLGEVFGFSLF
jgi:sulfite exporter TauE/SafE